VTITNSSIKDTLAGEFERGQPWNPRKNQDDPNPLYAEAVKWSTGTTAHGEAEFLSVRDDDGQLWSILAGSYDLRRDLIDGEVREWDDDAKVYRVSKTLGWVAPGELLAIEYRGERTYTNKEGRQVTSPDYRTLRKALPATSGGGSDNDIPFL
jgi:hypothetical protein